MKKAIAIRHIEFENLGIFEAELRTLGYAVGYFDAISGNFAMLQQEPPDLLIVLGGPIGAFDEEVHPFLTAELSVIQHRIEHALPLLGICLGAQLIARALGAKVYPMGHKEIGYFPLQLTPVGNESSLRPLQSLPVLHWHGDQFDIPVGAVPLASSALCPHQAFSYGDHILALQFHMEADSKRIDYWLVGHAAELAVAAIDPRDLRKQAQQFGPPLAQAALEVLRHWMALQRNTRS